MITTTLENLTEKVRENRLKQLAENIVKYQYFKTNVILNTIDNAGYSKSSLASYVNGGISYINTGNAHKQLGSLPKHIDEAIKKCIQPLTPRQDQKRINMRYRKYVKKVEKNIELPINKVLAKINKEVKPFDYAVRMNNNIRILNTQEEAQAFLEGLSFMGATDAKVIKVTIEEV